MKIVVIGATGTIGSAVAEALANDHEVVKASRHGEVKVDLDDPRSVASLFEQVQGVDAVVSCAGGARFAPLETLSDDDLAYSVKSKLMGQVNVIRHGLARVRDGGSVTVTSGVLARQPMPGAAAIAMVNAGLEGFVRGAALEAPRGIRVNVVSPPWVTETLEAMKMDTSQGLPAATVARAYVAAVTGEGTGETLDPVRLQ